VAHGVKSHAGQEDDASDDGELATGDGHGA
jgi:hypothetical protein